MVVLSFSRNTVGLLALAFTCLMSNVVADGDPKPCIFAPGQRIGHYSAFVGLPGQTVYKQNYENSPSSHDVATHPNFMNGYSFNVEILNGNSQDITISSHKINNQSPYKLWFVGFFDEDGKSIKQFYLAGWDTCKVRLEMAGMVKNFAQIGVYNLQDFK